MQRSAEDIVVRFCEAWQRRDLDDLTALMDDQVVYQNVPPPR